MRKTQTLMMTKGQLDWVERYADQFYFGNRSVAISELLREYLDMLDAQGAVGCERVVFTAGLTKTMYERMHKSMKSNGLISISEMVREAVLKKRVELQLLQKARPAPSCPLTTYEYNGHIYKIPAGAPK